MEDFSRKVASLLKAPSSAQMQKAEHLACMLAAASAGLWLANKVRKEGPGGLVKSVLGTVLATARALPGVSSAMEAAEDVAFAGLKEELVPADASARTLMQAEGLSEEQLQKLLQELLAKDIEESGFSKGSAFAGIYHFPDSPLTRVQTAAMSTFVNTNALYPGVFRSVRKMEAECVAMAVNILKGRVGIAGSSAAAAAATADPAPEACGLLTTGGTESVLMAVKAYRELAISQGKADPSRGLQAEIICGDSAHPALDKGCHYFGLKLVKLPVDAETLSLCPTAVAAAITPQTIAIYASAPSFPHGVMDPVPELAALAQSKGICLHVDNCLGGMLMSYLAAQGVKGIDACDVRKQLEAQRKGSESKLDLSPSLPFTPFDFSVPGVTSISMDLHKYGYAPKGASIVAFRTAQLRRFAYTVVTDWSGGFYATPSMTGSRGGANIAAAWATLLFMGGKAYAETAAEAFHLHQKLLQGISLIKGLQVIGRPTACIVSFSASPDAPFNIYAIAARMGERGWKMGSQRGPACINQPVTERLAPVMDKWLQDLRECVQEAWKNPKDSAYEGKGNAGIYGATGVLPPSELDRILMRYCDLLYLVRPEESSAGKK